MDIALALALVVVAVVLFSLDRIPMEVSALALVVLLVLSGLLTPKEAFAGFSSETVIFIFSLLAMTQGLAATGVMQLVGRRMLGLTRFGTRSFVAMLLAMVCATSSVASNTAVTAAYLPIAAATSARVRLPLSQVLMPLAFASMLGGTILLYGTSTNLVVSAEMAELGMRPLGFAELAPVGLPLAVVGLAVLALCGRWLMPWHHGEAQAGDAGREFFTVAELTPRSRYLGKPLAEISEVLGVPVVGLLRGGRALAPDPAHVLSPEDHLVVGGTLADILRVNDLRSLGLRAERPSEAPGRALLEVSLLPTSPLVGRSLADAALPEGLAVLAIHRHPSLERVRDLRGSLVSGAPMRSVQLAEGDVLLVGGQPEQVGLFARERELLVVGSIDYERPRYSRAALAVAIFVAAVTVAALGLLPAAVAGLCGMLLMLATGCVDARTAFRIDWKVVLLIGSLLALGLAMEKSGAGEFVARQLLPLASVVGARGVLCVLMLLTILLSVPMSNQAAALIMLPIALHAGADLGVAPRPFVIGICLAASCSFLTPLEPSAALVFGPGHYRFRDFLRAGAPLTALALVFFTVAIPAVWPFAAA